MDYSFLEPVGPFRVFGASTLARRIDKKAPIQLHNPGCQGFHPVRYCHRQPRCETCSSPMIEGQPHLQPCNLPPKCSNCCGPFPASHEGCPAKPIRKNGDTISLTGKELKAIRRIGQNSFLRVQQTNSQSTFGLTDSTSNSRRASASASSSLTSTPLSETSGDGMEITVNTQAIEVQLLDQQLGQQASNIQLASSQHRAETFRGRTITLRMPSLP